MSRIARIPVVLASGVDCKITADSLTLKGKVGEVSTHILPLVEIKQDGNTLHSLRRMNPVNRTRTPAR